MDIKAIETEYNGYRFRSRLEARWAVFLDALGIKYEYEPEGFEFENGMKYLPDFKVKCCGKRGGCPDISSCQCDNCNRNCAFDLYIEVKGKMTEADAKKINTFSKIYPVLIVGNIPPQGCSYDSSTLNAYKRMEGFDIYPFNYKTIDGDFFAAYPAGHGKKFYLWGDDCNYISCVEEVEEAYNKARRARFEHGEKP